MSLKKYFLLTLFVLTVVFLFAQGKVNPNHHYVRSYTRKDGTYVQGHNRTNPNSTNRDNYSTSGNFNPWTGKPGTVPPDNNPIPNYGTSSWNYFTPSYTPTYTPPASSSNRSSASSSRSTGSSGTTYYNSSTRTVYRKSDFYIAGPKVIRYSNGKEYFNVLATDKTNFKPGLTYYYYDPVEEEVLSAEGAAYGQLLDGSYKFYYPDGTLSVESNYKMGLQHGIHVSYDEGEMEQYRARYNEGKMIYYRGYNDDDDLVEWNGTPFIANSTRIFSRDGIVFKKEVYSSQNTYRVTEFDPRSGRIWSEGNYENNQLNGPFKVYYPENGKVNITGSFSNGVFHGIIKHYSIYGALTLLETYNKGTKEGLFEVYGANGKIIEKGAFKAGDLHGLYELYNPEEDILEKTMYLNGKANGSFEKKSGRFTVIKGSFLDDEPHGKWEYFVPDSDEKRVYLAVFTHYNRGKKNGSFKELHGDSILIGTYRNDLFHGVLKIYRPTSLWLMGYIPEDLKESDIIMRGEFIDGQKTGSWKHYDMTNSLIKEGYYYNDKKHGEWKYFYPVHVDSKFNRVPYSGKLYRVENYIEGKLNGKFEEFSSLERIRVPCDTTIGTTNPLDTCHKLILTEFRNIVYYKNGELHGPIEFSKEGLIVQKGNFLHGNKDGNWMTREEDGSVSTGNFVSDKKHGVWKVIWPKTGVVLRETAYSHDLKDGFEMLYHPSGKKLSQAFFRKGWLESVAVFDTLIQKPWITYDKLICRNNETQLVISLSKTDTLYATSFLLPLDLCNEALNHELLALAAFADQFTMDGPFTVVAPRGKILVEGNNKRGKLSGTRIRYNYEQGIKHKSQFDDGEVSSEFFEVIKGDTPFSGTFFSYSFGGVLEQKIKIKNGLRHGKTEVFLPSGKIMEVFKYKKGIQVI